MKRLLKILFIIFIVILILVAITFLWFIWKKNKDIKDMKKGISDLLVQSGMTRDKADSGADCFVNKSIASIGYLGFKGIYNGDYKGTDNEIKEINKAAASCNISENLLAGLFGSLTFNNLRNVIQPRF
jgi:hypothetical protein